VEATPPPIVSLALVARPVRLQRNSCFRFLRVGYGGAAGLPVAVEVGGAVWTGRDSVAAVDSRTDIVSSPTHAAWMRDAGLEAGIIQVFLTLRVG
jgi:hypothetical protein